MCTNPLIRYRYKKLRKGSTYLIPYTDEFEIKSFKKLQDYFENYGFFRYYIDEYLDYQLIPCRRCDECVRKYAQDWSIRCYHESLMHHSNCFITLTFSPEANKMLLDRIAKSYRNGSNCYCKKCINGNRYYNYPVDYSLNKFIVFDWLKRFRDVLRKDKGINFRYFGCGEYGGQDERAHFHILIFGYDFPDRQFFKNSDKGFPIYISEELNNSWKYGLTTVQDLDMGTCLYTAKYCTKKLRFGDAQEEYEYYYGRQPEFLFMSKGNCQSNRCDFIDDIIDERKIYNLRSLYNSYCMNCVKTRGGLGYSWFVKFYEEVVKMGYVVVDSVKYPIPKYYLEILKLTDLKLFDRLMSRRINYQDDFFEKYPLEFTKDRLEVKRKVNRGKLLFYSSRDL